VPFLILAVYSILGAFAKLQKSTYYFRYVYPSVRPHGTTLLPSDEFSCNVKFKCLIFMEPCILDDSVEIPKRCSLVIEFIIPKFIEGSTCFERHTAHHKEL